MQIVDLNKLISYKLKVHRKSIKSFETSKIVQKKTLRLLQINNRS